MRLPGMAATVAAGVTAAVVTLGVTVPAAPPRADGPADVRSAVVSQVSEVSEEAEARAVLAAWDAERSRAWATGDVRRLRALYVRGSAAGHEDADRLRQWVGRGLRVTGLRTQVLALQVLDHAADRWEVRVTDRQVGAQAQVAGRKERAGPVALPRQAPATHVLTLVRRSGGWQVARVVSEPGRDPRR